jgi:hypothetical protein
LAPDADIYMHEGRGLYFGLERFFSKHCDSVDELIVDLNSGVGHIRTDVVINPHRSGGYSKALLSRLLQL